MCTHRVENASELAGKAMAMRERALGPEHPATLESRKLQVCGRGATVLELVVVVVVDGEACATISDHAGRGSA